MSEITIQHAVTQLAKKDKILKKLIKTHCECTLKPLSQPHYHVLVWAIINQQLSVKAAASIETKLKTLVRSETFEPQLLLEHPEPALKQCGLSRSKIRYIHNLADSQPTKGNILGGLTTIEEKALGNLEKIGRTSTYIDAMGPAETPAKEKHSFLPEWQPRIYQTNQNTRPVG